MKTTYFISDLDGTLLRKRGKIHRNDLEKIKNRSKEVEFCIATGRHIGEVMNDLQLHHHAKYIITCNGNEIHEVKDGEVIQLYEGPTFTDELMMKILQIGKKYRGFRIVATANEYLCENKNMMLSLIEKMHGLKHKPVKSLMEYLKENKVRPIKLLFIFSTKEGKHLRAELEEVLGEQIDVTMSNAHCVEVNMKGVSKGTAITWLKDQLAKDAMYVCVGDNDNDLSMIAACHYSFAMDSGLVDLKEAATETVLSVGDALSRLEKLNQNE